MIRRITRKRASLVLLALLPAVACSSSSSRPAPLSGREAVLMRTFWVLLGPETKMGNSRPPLDSFAFQGTIPGGKEGKAQLEELKSRLTLPGLGFQYSDSTFVDVGQTATLQMGFGEQIHIELAGLRSGEGESLATDVSVHFGEKEVLRQTVSFKLGEALLFAGRLDNSLPTLSVFSLEPRIFPTEKRAELDEFIHQSRLDMDAFAPPPPKQRDKEPYLPGVGDVTMPELISFDKAPYPEAAKAEKLEGQVIVEVVVNRNGEATNPRIITPPSIFDYDSLVAAKTYRYHPATKNGQPVAVTMNLIMVYKLSTVPH